MKRILESRREFLKLGGSVVSASWLAMNSSLVLAAGGIARSNLESQAPFDNLSPEQAFELGAVVDQIIPEDETPGAKEAGVLFFIDVALGGFMSGAKQSLVQGLAELQEKTASSHPGSDRFSGLSFAQQTSVLREIEDTPFFGTVQFLTVCGMFSLPRYGGNRDHSGWELLEFDHRHAWQPPFGYYDEAVHGGGDAHEQV